MWVRRDQFALGQGARHLNHEFEINLLGIPGDKVVAAQSPHENAFGVHHRDTAIREHRVPRVMLGQSFVQHRVGGSERAVTVSNAATVGGAVSGTS